MGESPLTTLDDALTGVTALAFDTSPFIYFVERHPRFLPLLRDIFGKVDSGVVRGYGSVITLTEVLTRPLQMGDTQLVSTYREFLQHGRNFTMIPIDAAIAERAAYFRARYRLRTPDALQLATAAGAGCQAFLRNDRDLRRVSDLQVLVLEDLDQ